MHIAPQVALNRRYGEIEVFLFPVFAAITAPREDSYRNLAIHGRAPEMALE